MPGSKSADQGVMPAVRFPPPTSAGGGTRRSPSTTTTGTGGGTSPSRSTVTTAPVQPPATTAVSGPFHISGQLLCESGHAVVGVWVQTANAAHSRFAAWKGVGDGSTADWWTDLPMNESYSLNVGCGGTPSSWRTSNHTGVHSGAHNSFNCDDIPEHPDYERCTRR
ncbi:hypothetical protein [Streptomyces sp.]|uniref:hypothetical protein n=1 Tax=Streptomyces sp. TaxID=1931 RepID=UPI002F421A25